MGWAISAVLLIRFTVDFAEGMSWWLVVPFCVLVIATLALGFANIFSRARERQGPVASLFEERKGSIAWALLLAAVPISFLTSSLDCTGLSPYGCSSFCTFVKLVWIPMIALLCGAYLLAGKPEWLTAIVLASFVTLIPHCVCHNVGNSWWINRIGASPLCYGWGFSVSVLVVGAIRSRSNLGPSLAICAAIVLGSTGFFVSHHYFQYPW